MPNRYYFRDMTVAEFKTAKTVAGLSDSDLQVLFGRHRFDIVKLLNGEMTPRPLEAVMLEYLARHPDKVPEFLELAESRVTGASKDEGRAARRAHLQRER